MSAQPQDLVFPWQERPMQEADLEQILAIERQAYQFPWSEGVFRDCLRMRYTCRVAVSGESEIDGYALMSEGAGEAHILNLCVAEDRRGAGLGRYLLGRLMNVARQKRVGAIYLEVRPTNDAAIALYKSAGFTEIGLRRGYYPAAGGREDAILLAHIF